MRIHLKRFLRTAFICVVFLFILLNMHVMMYITEEPHQYSHRPQHHNIAEAHVQFGAPNHTVVEHQSSAQKEENTHVFVYPSSVVNFSNTAKRIKINTSNIFEIKNAIFRINEKQEIHNIDKFGLRLDADSTVIVVQVHDRGEYLKILLDSLRKVRNIRNTLVVISHDFYSEDINDVVHAVEFCPVMQIFFPYSLQTHPNEFPGFHPNDCPRNVKKPEAMKKNCNNAHYPDKYGHYREPKYSQTKHHWFWKLQHVFERINVLKNYVGNVLLLEEDYYVVEDAIFILQMMQNFRKKECKECKILALGNYDKTQNLKVNAGKVENALWISSKHNMGMTFNRELWNDIKKCGKNFCEFDDYNWDWTLQHLSSKCFKEKMKVLKMKASRVFHMGDCGVHHKGKNCNPKTKREELEKILNLNKQYLFPNVVSLGGKSGVRLRDPKPNGGWGDVYRWKKPDHPENHRVVMSTCQLPNIKIHTIHSTEDIYPKKWLLGPILPPKQSLFTTVNKHCFTTRDPHREYQRKGKRYYSKRINCSREIMPLNLHCLRAVHCIGGMTLGNGQVLATAWWFSSCTLASFTNKPVTDTI